jgi:hypothetical protein
VFGVQVATGQWAERVVYHDYHAYVDKRWLIMEIATILAGLALVGVYRLAFITMPIALTLWYMGMDLTPLIAQYIKLPTAQPELSALVNYWDLKLWVSVCFGVVTMLCAFLVDISTKGEKDFAFWPYLTGLLSFWFGLSLMHSDSEVSKAIYALINLVLIFMGPFLMRKTFTVFGAIGLTLYISEQAVKRFADSPGLLFIMLAIAGAIMYLGFLWHRHEKKIVEKISWITPRKLRERWAPA